MTRYSFDLYPRTDPRDGTLVARLEDLQRAEYRGEANGAGVGLMALRGESSDGQLIDPAGLQYVRVVADDTDDVVGGFFLDAGSFEAINERHTRLLEFHGAGTLSYLDREVMWTHTYLTDAIYRDPYDGSWRLYAQGPIAGGDFLGAVLYRVIHEAQAAPVGAYTHRHGDGTYHTGTHDDDRVVTSIPDVVTTFDGFEDSDGNPWTLPSGEFTAQVGESVYQVVQRLMQAGLYVEMDADTFELRAWEASGHRRDRTGGAFGVDVVRFEAGENIKSDANRQLAAFIRRTAILASTSEDVAALVTGPGDVEWHGGIRSDLGEVAALEQLATAELSSRTDAGDTLRLRMRLGDDPANGTYRPWEEIQLDDVVTVDSGAGQWDWNEREFPVAALEIKLRTEGAWDAFVELGSVYTSAPERSFQAVAGPSSGLRLCDPSGSGGFVATGSEWKIYDLPGAEPSGWQDVGFDDSAWSDAAEFTGAAGMQSISSPDAPDFIPGAVALARREYTVQSADLSGSAVAFRYAFDNAGKVYVNGVQVAILTGTGSGNYNGDHATTLARSNFVAGLNVVAIRIENDPGGSLGNIPPGSHSAAVQIEMPVDGDTGLAGSDGRAARCDHGHVHNDLAGRNAVDAHPASSVLADDDTTVQDHIDDDDMHGGGAGVTTELTQGTVSSIATTGTPAFLNTPGIAKLDADHLLVLYRQGTDHDSSADGNIVYRIGTVAADYSVSWSSQSTVIGTANDLRDPEVSVLADGTVIASYFESDNSTFWDVKIIRATWDGSALTWGSAVAVATDYSLVEAISAKIVELFNGDLLAPIYGRDGAGNHSAAVSRSTDGGDTWAHLATIATGTIGAGNNWTEPYISLLADGTLHCLIREDTDGVIYRSTSVDGGATWSTPAVAFGGDARPAHLQVQSGGLLHVSRADPNGDTIYRESADYGVTWTTETVVDSAGTRNEYASVAQFDSYHYAVVYAIQNSSSDADVKFAWFTDAANLDVIRGIGAGGGGGGGAPSGAAGGDLSGTYPNPSVTDDSHSHTSATLPAPTPVAFCGARVYNSAVQSIAENTTDVIALFNTELYDTDAIHDTGSNTGRMTIPTGKAGKWRFTYHIAWDVASATGIRMARLVKNAGLTPIEGSDARVAGQTAFNPTLTNTVVVDLVAGDYIQIGLFQNRGGGTALNTGFAHATNPSVVNTFEAQYLG